MSLIVFLKSFSKINCNQSQPWLLLVWYLFPLGTRMVMLVYLLMDMKDSMLAAAMGSTILRVKDYLILLMYITC